MPVKSIGRGSRPHTTEEQGTTKWVDSVGETTTTQSEVLMGFMDDAKKMADDAATKAKQVAADAKEKSGPTMDKAKATAGEWSDKAKATPAGGLTKDFGCARFRVPMMRVH